MMRDNLVRRVADGRLDEDVEAARDEDGRDEAQQEEEDHVVSHELSSTEENSKKIKVILYMAGPFHEGPQFDFKLFFSHNLIT